jgi:hypothetical protein
MARKSSKKNAGVPVGVDAGRTPIAIDHRPAALAASVAAAVAAEPLAEPAVSLSTAPALSNAPVDQDAQPVPAPSEESKPARSAPRLVAVQQDSDEAEDGEILDETRDPDSPIRILLMCNYDPYNAATVCDHINSFYKYSKHEIYVFSNIGDLMPEFTFDPFDVVIVHYSLFIAIDAYFPPSVRSRLAAFGGVKVLFIQDEYRFVNQTIDALNFCGIDIVFTCVPEAEIPKVYPPHKLPKTRFINVLTGYVPDSLKLFKARPLAERPTMVGYRGRVYPAWHGAAGREKHEIGRRFLADAKKYDIKCDIAWSEESRLYGIHWVNFLRSCWATLAVESGASVFDFDGTIAAATETFTGVLGLSGKQSRKVKRLLHRHKPFNQEPHDREIYEQLRQLFFAHKEGLIDLAQLSPRVFEAATLRTMLIMYEGSYSGAFKPWRHYAPLKKDHSNMAQIVELLRDPIECAKIITHCYSEVCENELYSSARFIASFDRIISDAVAEDHRSEVREFTKEEFYKWRMFYYVPFVYSLDPLGHKRLPRHPVRLAKALFKPGPNDLTLKEFFMRYVRRHA